MASSRVRDAIEEAPFEMANLRPATTGLPFAVFVSQRGAARHGARIKVSPLPRYDPDEAVTITLEVPPRALGRVAPKDLRLAQQWIDLNRAALLAYWEGTIAYTEDLLAQIRPIPAP
jgi:hypothetical protein